MTARFDARHLQERLTAAGHDIGAVDGVAGKRTYAALLAHVAGRPVAMLMPLAIALAADLPRYGIDATPARLANFIGQAAHESGDFRYLSEIWGPTPAQKGYEGHAALGNTQPGDGYTYRGRGIFQLTGRANYREIGERIGQPLEDEPGLAQRPDIAVLTACDFWDFRQLNALADAGREDEITRRINGGTNGIDERRRLVAKVKGLLA